MITQTLERSGVLGSLSSEFFNPAWERDLSLTHHCVLWREYLDCHALPAGTTPNGVFGWKQNGEYLPYLLWKLRRNEPDSAGLDDLALLQKVFPGLDPNTSFIYIWRRKLLMQAASRVIAETSGRWVSQDVATAEPKFNLDLLKNAYFLIMKEHADWQNWFKLNGITPLCLNYEDVVADPWLLRGVFEHVGIECPPDAILKPSCRKQRTSLNHDWVKRFRRLLEEQFAFAFPELLDEPRFLWQRRRPCPRKAFIVERL